MHGGDLRPAHLGCILWQHWVGALEKASAVCWSVQGESRKERGFQKQF